VCDLVFAPGHLYQRRRPIVIVVHVVKLLNPEYEGEDATCLRFAQLEVDG
jgi:hypothetical protein